MIVGVLVGRRHLARSTHAGRGKSQIKKSFHQCLGQQPREKTRKPPGGAHALGLFGQTHMDVTSNSGLRAGNENVRIFLERQLLARSCRSTMSPTNMTSRYCS
jgi:hypothetical protein